jgi:hypothetical protein
MNMAFSVYTSLLLENICAHLLLGNSIILVVRYIYSSDLSPKHGFGDLSNSLQNLSTYVRIHKLTNSYAAKLNANLLCDCDSDLINNILMTQYICMHA